MAFVNYFNGITRLKYLDYEAIIEEHVYVPEYD